jgi:hypothetical protein
MPSQRGTGNDEPQSRTQWLWPRKPEWNIVGNVSSESGARHFPWSIVLRQAIRGSEREMTIPLASLTRMSIDDLDHCQRTGPRTN